MKNGLYSVTDKALFDALIQSKVTHENMKDLFFKRGIIISKETGRKSLAADFSRYFHGFSDYDKLSNILGSVGRREKSTTNIINGGVDRAEVEAALKETITALKKEGDIANFAYVENEGIEVTIKYIKLDYKLSEFRQSSTREAKILIEPTDDGLFHLRFPPNSKAQEFVEIFTNSLKSIDKEKQISIDEITLESVKDPLQRTLFFKKLIESIDTYEFMDVSDVYVSHQDIEIAKTESVSDIEENDEENDEEVKVETGYHISKASLKGRGVLDSPELNNFLRKDFYITRIIWTAKVRGFPDSDKAEFEAQFIDSDKCTLFSYLVRGYYKYISIAEFRDTKVSFDKEKEKLISSYIEKAARDISNDIIRLNTVSVKTD
ncbi:TPA: hypothetical protein L9M45_005061 [Klebsiella quasipneumoniae subsp. quasipneumoniae]|nr:hypothetical protein [Klebsiella quasipneumoniae subsp. quasipneumoniae]HBR1958225.1 hypothetical protein [Klebsiella quasipneumoniae subsp. quasipneumoniae]